MNYYSRIKILFSIPNFITAGSGREMMNIIDRLNPDQFEPIIHLHQPGGMLYQEAIDKGITLIVRDCGYRLFNFRGIIRFMKDIWYFRKKNIKIWQSFDWSSAYTEAIIAKCSGIRFVYLKKNMNQGRKAWAFKYWLSDRIIARNTVMNETFLRAYKSKVKLIHGAVDTSVFKPASSARNEKKEIIQVVCVAQLVRVKGQDLLIKALANFPEMRLSIIGASRDDRYRSELENLIRELGMTDSVVLMGPRTDIPDILRSADIFVLPTSRVGGHEEGCPVALLEAMASGTICVGSKVAGITDIIFDGINGFLFEADNIESLIDALSKVKKIFGTSSIGNHARSMMVSNFSLSRESSQFEAVYKELV